MIIVTDESADIVVAEYDAGSRTSIYHCLVQGSRKPPDRCMPDNKGILYAKVVDEGPFIPDKAE